MRPLTRRRIGLLIEGHVQYQFMSIEQIERFYAAFYPKWRREAYYEPDAQAARRPWQRISRMSCGQRSQVALGLILAQDPDLLVLDDFSLGLDPGYRRLFADYLREYAKAEGKTVFLTSHIIQDMERLIDDCIIMDYGRILLQRPVGEILDRVARRCARGGPPARGGGAPPPRGGGGGSIISLVPAVRGRWRAGSRRRGFPPKNCTRSASRWRTPSSV